MPQIAGSKIELGNIRISRGGRPVVVDSSGSAEAGVPVMLTGPNGSGKTTLLEMIAGILPLESGAIRSDGVEIQPKAVQWRTQVSYSPANGGTIPVLTVNDQLSLAAVLDGLPIAEARRRIETVVAMFGLRDHENHRAEHLSTGFAKRLSLAIAAMRTAPIYLFDEPTAGVDEMGVPVVNHLISELSRSGRIVILATNSRSLLLEEESREWRLVASGHSPGGSQIEGNGAAVSRRSAEPSVDRPSNEPSLSWLRNH